MRVFFIFVVVCASDLLSTSHQRILIGIVLLTLFILHTSAEEDSLLDMRLLRLVMTHFTKRDIVGLG
jgi:hypothetical protein